MAKYNQFKPARVDYAPDRKESGESAILRWQHHLNAVHAYIAVPQCNYFMNQDKEKKDVYSADIEVNDELVFKDVRLQVPEVHKPPVIGRGHKFSISVFKKLPSKQQRELASKFPLLKPLATKSKHQQRAQLVCTVCGKKAPSNTFWKHILNQKKPGCK